MHSDKLWERTADNQAMKSHWKPPSLGRMAGFLPCCPAQRPLAPTPCNANTASFPWTDRHRPPTSAALAHLPMVTKTSLSAAGTKEGKGLNFDEVIKPRWLARLVKDNGRADSTSLKSCCLLANLGTGSPFFLLSSTECGHRAQRYVMNVSGKD